VFENGLVKNNASAITTNLQNDLTGFVAAVQPNGSNPGGNTPQAFLTILFFDERFNFIDAADGGVVQQQVAASVTADGSTLAQSNIAAPKNGYAYVYISNQSNLDVFFDNLKVQVVTGNIIEENHYYAYGLKIAGISSKKLGDTYEGTLKNNYLYQGDFSEFDDDIGWNDFELRNYDPQIGRWVQMDPYADYYISSPYAGMANDPANTVDPSGGLIASGLFQGATQFGKTVGMMVLGAIVGGVIDHASGGEGWTGVALGAAIGIGSSFSFTITAKVVQAANVAITIINTSTISKHAGTAIRGNQSNSGHGPNAGIGKNDFSFANYDYNSSLDFSNDEISIDPDPLVIGPILRWLPKVLKPIWQKGIVPASKWVWRQIKTGAKKARDDAFAKAITKIDIKNLQALARKYSKELNAFFQSKGTEIPSKEILVIYKELAQRMLNKTGGAYQKLTDAAAKLHTERIEMIDKALKTLK
jgi:RHS repeat-associated protein